MKPESTVLSPQKPMIPFVGEWPVKAITVICLLIPLAALPWLNDPFGMPKMICFLAGCAVLAPFILANLPLLKTLPRTVKLGLGIFLSIQLFQALRAGNIPEGIFGAYGQSESFIVQFGFVILFLAGYLYLNRASVISGLERTLFIAILLAAIAGICHYMLFPKTSINSARAVGLLGDPNTLGAFLVLTLPVAIRYCTVKGLLDSKIALSAVFLGISCLTLTFSRGAWIGFAATLMIMGWFFFRTKDSRLVKGFISVIIVVFLAIGAAFLLNWIRPIEHKSYSLSERVSSIAQWSVDNGSETEAPQKADVFQPGKATHDSGRSILWRTAWSIFKSSPFWGYGIGSFQETFHRFRPENSIHFWGPDRDLKQTHNETLHYLASQGLIGLLSYLLCLGVILWAAFRQTKKTGNLLNTIPFWAGAIGYLLFVQTAYPLIHYSFLFWLYLGIILARPAQDPHSGLPLAGVNGWVLFPFILLVGFFLSRFFMADLHIYQAHKAFESGKYCSGLTFSRLAVQNIPWSYYYQTRHATLLLDTADKLLAEENGVPAMQYLREAEQTLRRLTSSYSRRYLPHYLLGQVYASQGNFAAAIPQYRRAVGLYRGNYKIWAKLVKADILTGAKTQAYYDYTVGSVISPSYMRQSLIQDGYTLFLLKWDPNGVPKEMR